MADPSALEPSIASSSFENDGGRPEGDPLVAALPDRGTAATGQAEEATNGVRETITRPEETKRATAAADGSSGATPGLESVRNPQEITDPDLVSDVHAVSSTLSSLHTVIDAPSSSDTLFDDVLVAAGGSGSDGGLIHGGGDIGGTGEVIGGIGGTGGVGGGVGGAGGVSGDEGGVGGESGATMMSLGGVDVLVGDDVVLEDFGTGKGDGGGLGGDGSLVGGAVRGGVGGDNGDGSGPSIPPGDSGVGTSRTDKGKGIAVSEPADAPLVTKETVFEVLREVEAEERARAEGPWVLVVEVAQRALLVRPAFHADTYDPPMYRTVPSAIDSYTSLQERYDGEEVLLNAGRHLSRDCLDVRI